MKDEDSREAGAPKDDSSRPGRTSDARVLSASTPTNWVQWPERTTNATELEVTNVPVTPKLGESRSPMELGTFQGSNIVPLLERVTDPQPSTGFSGQSLSSRLTDPGARHNLASRLQPSSRPGARPAPTKPVKPVPSLLDRMA
ncbi:hypothetical protein M407DRAFT_243810 [Tulasnella calospora MUT 4182]|uniref:Uncharacterized protein n=1 Tax=Tulasnella calospora MUT 4182 TaxID=1051891 RepID=A0A0C3KXX7_9AGAM|nr:hypothetical protein M407DRAFT_243810 [Tulasnella calospora MUT 4182]